MEKNQSEEILNIDYHTRRLVLKSLNSHKMQFQAIAALGISARTFYRMKSMYGIYKAQNGIYHSKQLEKEQQHATQKLHIHSTGQ